MSLVVYLHPSGGTDPGHMVIGQEPPITDIAYFGYRFNVLDLPAEFRPPGKWREYLFENHVPGDIVDESDYVESMETTHRAGYFQKRTRCVQKVTELVPDKDKWRRYARYSFNPDDFVKLGHDCYNCVTWSVTLANKIIAGFLKPVTQGRVKEIVKQLEPCA